MAGSGSGCERPADVGVRPSSRRRPSRRWAAAYWGCAVAHAVGHWLDIRSLRMVTKAALMPSLAAWCRSHGCPRLLVAALLLSGGGDYLMERKRLLPGMAMYAGAHACYVTLFIRDRRRLRWPTAAAYGTIGAAVTAFLWPGLGPLRAPVAGYSSLLTATAVTSTWYDRRSAVGGALFLISDALIGTQLAGHDFPARAPLVGMTYTAGQYNLAAGVITRDPTELGRT
jgi:uncharacterized membrane protein YhhN